MRQAHLFQYLRHSAAPQSKGSRHAACWSPPWPACPRRLWSQPPALPSFCSLHRCQGCCLGGPFGGRRLARELLPLRKLVFHPLPAANSDWASPRLAPAEWLGQIADSAGAPATTMSSPQEHCYRQLSQRHPAAFLLEAYPGHPPTHAWSRARPESAADYRGTNPGPRRQATPPPAEPRRSRSGRCARASTASLPS